jgi:hypothetical protein
LAAGRLPRPLCRDDHGDVGLKGAQKLFIIGNLPLSNDVFMYLFNCLTAAGSFQYRIDTL